MPGRSVFLMCGIFAGHFLFGGIPELRAQPVSQQGPSFEKNNWEEKEVKVSPIEDMNGEHGIVDRVLLIFDEIIRRIEKKETLPLGAISKTVEFVRMFIQGHHEKLEEKYIFSTFHKPGTLADLTVIMVRQHRAGQKVIEVIGALEKKQGPAEMKKIADCIHAFVRMYRPHKAWEDTIIFPAFHDLVPPREYDELGVTFEEEEEKHFGQGCFAKLLERVAAIERSLGMSELAQFTPAP